jgi:hypothetical protein
MPGTLHELPVYSKTRRSVVRLPPTSQFADDCRTIPPESI